MASNPFITSAASQTTGMSIDPEAQGIQRQRQFAAALLNQTGQMPQGQNVSGIYVAPSWTQSLSAAVNPLVGAYMMNKADTKAEQYAKALREEGIRDIGRIMEATQGRPESISQVQATEQNLPQGQTMLDDQGQRTLVPQVTPAAGPDYNRALAVALGSRSPVAQSMGAQILGEMMKPQKLGEGEQFVRFNPETNKYEAIASGGSKLPPDVKAAAIFLGINKPESEWTTQERALVEQKASAFREKGAMNTGQKGLDNTLKLRGDFRSEPIYKDFQAIDSAYRQINKSLDAKTAAGDLAASTKLMKLLDPTSVVRESELVMAMQATGKLDQLYNYANKIATGQFLSPKQKDEFRTQAREFYNSAGDQYNLKRNEYAEIAKRNDLNVTDVVGPEVKFIEQPKVTSGLPSQNDIQAEINRRLGLKNNPQGSR